MMVFSSDANKEHQAELYRDVGQMLDGYGFVEGGNWMVNCDTRPVCLKVADILGGRTETLPLI
ncbi:hypothetical protein [Gordonia sp. NPDC003950]